VSRTTLETVDLLANGPFDVIEIDERSGPVSTPARLVIFDSYEWDWTFERVWRARNLLQVAIDDLANRRHDCDLLVDPTPGREIAQYEDIVPRGCEVLAGASYALLRPEFRRLRSDALQRRSRLYPRRILISMGLTDVQGVTRRVTEGAMLADPHWTIDVVVGRHAESLPWLQSVAMDGRLNTYVDLDSWGMADLMMSADVAIGGGGGTSLERCCMGLPSLVILLADNQRFVAETLRNAGAIRVIGDLDSVTPERIAAALGSFAQDGEERVRCSRRASSVVDGGGADRVCQAIVRRLG
jgi:UDP-2,4-diacetamido-2,4,6-trideoxy-beta-L-altropyranose hydrolase